MASRASLASDGTFTIADIQSLNDIDGRRAQTVADVLTSEGLLRIVDQDDTVKRYTFAEEGLPTFFWITWAQQNLQPAETRKAAAAAASAS